MKVRNGCAPRKGGAFQWVQIPPGEISQSEATGAIFCQRYVALCERFGVTRVTPERARELVETWDAMFASAAVTKQ